MRQFPLLLLAALLAATNVLSEDSRASDPEAAKPEVDDSEYQAVGRAVLLAAPEEFKGKRLAVKAKFMGLNTDFPSYLENAGIKPAKYLFLKVGLRDVPPLLSKDKGGVAQVGSLKEGDEVTVYGKVKKLKRKSKSPDKPQYYLAVDTVRPSPASDKPKADKAERKDGDADVDEETQDLQDKLMGKRGKRERKDSGNPVAPESDGDKAADKGAGDNKADGKKSLWFE